MSIYENKELREKIVAMYEETLKSLSSKDTTEKQAMAAAAILVADRLISKALFHDDPLTEDEIGEFLASKASVSLGERGYQWLLDWVAQNQSKFYTTNKEEVVFSDLYGEITLDEIYIISSVFDKAVSEAGFSSTALKSWMKQSGKLRVGKKGMTVDRRIAKVFRNQCVCVLIPPDDEEDRDDDLPYIP